MQRNGSDFLDPRKKWIGESHEINSLGNGTHLVPCVFLLVRGSIEGNVIVILSFSYLYPCYLRRKCDYDGESFSFHQLIKTISLVASVPLRDSTKLGVRVSGIRVRI